MKKRLAALFLTAATVISIFTIPTASAESRWPDVKTTAWYFDDVMKANDLRLMEGVQTGNFEPGRALTRAEYVAILARMCDAVSNSKNSFTDVPAKAWYAKYVGWAVENGIITGFPDNTFRANVSVTREQMAVMTARYLEMQKVNLPDSPDAVSSFTDAGKISSWAVDAVDLMRSTGIINGDNKGAFNPSANAKRCEIAAMAVRIVAAVDEYDRYIMENPIDLPIVSGGESDYTIMYLDLDESPIIQSSIQNVRNAIKDSTGVSLKRITAYSTSGNFSPRGCQIIIGDYPEYTGVDYQPELPSREYMIKSVGNNLIVTAKTEAALLYAVDELVAMIEEMGKDGELMLDNININGMIPVEAAGTERNAYKDFVLTYYFGPDPAQCTDELVASIAEAGFTRMAIEAVGTTEQIRDAVALAEKYGMDVCMYLHHELGSYNYSNSTYTQEEVDAKVQTILDRFGDLNAVVEWQIRDEPYVDDFEALGMIVDAFHRLDTNKTRAVLINLFPDRWGVLGTSCEDYLEQFVNICGADSISFDRYQFCYEPAVLQGAGYLDNLYKVMNSGIQHNLPTTMIVLASGHWNYSIVQEEQLRWEANINLAYGCKAVSYFTLKNLGYASEDLANKNGGMYTMDWEPTEQYYAVKNISKDVVPVGQELVDNSLLSVFTIKTDYDSATPEYTSFRNIGEIGGSRGVIGCYDDGSFYLTNFVFETGAEANVFTLNDFNGSSIEWFDPADSAWKAAENNPEITKTDDGYTVVLPSGDGVLLRIVD